MVTLGWMPIGPLGGWETYSHRNSRPQLPGSRARGGVRYRAKCNRFGKGCELLNFMAIRIAGDRSPLYVCFTGEDADGDMDGAKSAPIQLNLQAQVKTYYHSHKSGT